MGCWSHEKEQNLDSVQGDLYDLCVCVCVCGGLGSAHTCTQEEQDESLYLHLSGNFGSSYIHASVKFSSSNNNQEGAAGGSA